MNILLLIYFVRRDGSKIYLNSDCVITIRNKVIKLFSSFASNRLGAAERGLNNVRVQSSSNLIPQLYQSFRSPAMTSGFKYK